MTLRRPRRQTNTGTRRHSGRSSSRCCTGHRGSQMASTRPCRDGGSPWDASPGTTSLLLAPCCITPCRIPCGPLASMRQIEHDLDCPIDRRATAGHSSRPVATDEFQPQSSLEQPAAPCGGASRGDSRGNGNASLDPRRLPVGRGRLHEKRDGTARPGCHLPAAHRNRPRTGRTRSEDRWPGHDGRHPGATQGLVDRPDFIGVARRSGDDERRRILTPLASPAIAMPRPPWHRHPRHHGRGMKAAAPRRRCATIDDHDRAGHAGHRCQPAGNRTRKRQGAGAWPARRSGMLGTVVGTVVDTVVDTVALLEGTLLGGTLLGGTLLGGTRHEAIEASPADAAGRQQGIEPRETTRHHLDGSLLALDQAGIENGPDAAMPSDRVWSERHHVVRAPWWTQPENEHMYSIPTVAVCQLPGRDML